MKNQLFWDWYLKGKGFGLRWSGVILQDFSVYKETVLFY